MTSYIVVLIVLVLAVVEIESGGTYAPHWAVQVRGGILIANQIAARHGLVNKGLIANLDNVYDFALPNGTDSKEPMSDITKALLLEPEVSYVEQQHYRKMVPKAEDVKTLG